MDEEMLPEDYDDTSDDAYNEENLAWQEGFEEGYDAAESKYLSIIQELEERLQRKETGLNNILQRIVNDHSMDA